MRILLDCRPLQQEGADSERSHFIFSTVAALARDKGVEWLFLADPSLGSGSLPSLPGSSVVLNRCFPGAIGWRLWYDRVIPRRAKKHKADLLMLTGGISAASGSVPQCLWMPEQADPAVGKDQLRLYSRRLRESLRRAALVFCFSAADRDWLTDRQRVDKQQRGDTDRQRTDAIRQADPEKIVSLSAWPAETAAPLSADERERTKREYAAGKEYFLADAATADAEGIVQLLKSFSLFKKRQLSNLQLVLTGQKPLPESELTSRLETYKYRQDIHWYAETNAEIRLTGAAYALLFPFEKKTLGVPVLNAWAAEVPVIIGKETGVTEWAGDGVLVADRKDPASLAGHLMSVYKDEQLRRRLIEKGRSGVAAFDLRQSLALVWEHLTRIAPDTKVLG